MTKKSKNKSPAALKRLVKQLEKEHGKGVIRLGIPERPGFVESGILAVDWVLGGGLPLGRFTEFFGRENSGKTTLALRFVSIAQQQGISVFFFDAERKLDSRFASYLGVDRSKVMISNINIGDTLIEIISSLIENQKRKVLIVIDSIPSIIMKDDADAPATKKTIASSARVWNKALPIWNSLNRKDQATVLLINQMRDAIGSFIPGQQIQPGGKQIKHLTSIRLEIKKGSWIKDKDKDVIGYTMKFRTAKSQVGPPFRQGQVDFSFVKREFDIVKDLIWAICKFKVLPTSGGGWIEYKGDKIRAPEFRELLQDPEIYEGLYLEVKEKIGEEK